MPTNQALTPIPRYRGYIPAKRPGRGWYIVELYLGSDYSEGLDKDDYPADYTEELTLPADDALKIEWSEMAPETPVQGSSATLRIESPSDRHFAGLYAYNAGDVWIRVWWTSNPKLQTVEPRLVWQGALDPEQYEEPYERREDYTVELTFSDFGYLDRLKYDLQGLRSLDFVLRYALERAGFPPSASLVSYDLISTIIGDGVGGELPAQVLANSANFYDEEGEASTLREVIEGLLLPLGLHLTQRDGRILLFDTNALWQQPPREVYWSADSQKLATGETYNNVTITFSPYAGGSLLIEDYEYKGDTSSAFSWINYKPQPIQWYEGTGDDSFSAVEIAAKGLQFTFAVDLSAWETADTKVGIYDPTNASFAIFFNSEYYNGLTIHSAYSSPDADDDGLGFRYYHNSDFERDGRDYAVAASASTDYWPKAFRLVPFGEGEEAEGVAVTMVGGAGLLENAFGYEEIANGGQACGGKVCRYGVQADTPWGYKNNTALLGSYMEEVLKDTWQYDELDYFCSRTAPRSLFTTPRTYLPPVITEPIRITAEDGDTSGASSVRRTTHYIRLELPMLLDCRYNPTTDAGKFNQEVHQQRLTEHTRWLFIPFTAVLYNEEGRIIYTYSNRRMLFNNTDSRLAVVEGEWLPAGRCGAVQRGVEPTVSLRTDRNYDTASQRLYTSRAVSSPDHPGSYLGEAWLAWYASDPTAEKSTGVGGWQSNRHCIGRPDVGMGAETSLGISGWGKRSDGFTVNEALSRLDAGQYIPYPPAAGYLEITIYAGMLGFADDEAISPVGEGEWLATANCYDRGDGRRGIYNLIRWQLFKAPIVEIVKNDMNFDSVEMDDVEYSAYLDKTAHEKLPLDTIFGTAADASPTARGIMYTRPDGADSTPEMLTIMQRGPLSARPEKLLMGTLYSQYSRRRTGLSGEARLNPPETGALLRPWADQNTPDVRFYELARVDNLSAGTSELTLMEFRPDDYGPDDIAEVSDD